MALIKCPECGQEISDKSSKYCSYCGCPNVEDKIKHEVKNKKNKKKWPVYLIPLIVISAVVPIIIIVFIIIVGMGNDLLESAGNDINNETKSSSDIKVEEESTTKSVSENLKSKIFQSYSKKGVNLVFTDSGYGTEFLANDINNFSKYEDKKCYYSYQAWDNDYYYNAVRSGVDEILAKYMSWYGMILVVNSENIIIGTLEYRWNAGAPNATVANYSNGSINYIFESGLVLEFYNTIKNVQTIK